MSINEQKCVALLQKGIELKRNGYLREALDQYDLAYKIYPYNKDIYKNIAKIFMTLNEQQDMAMRNLLTYAHLTMIDGNIDMESYDFAVSFYNWSGKISDQTTIQPDFVIKAVSFDFNLAKIISDLNLTFFAGFCFIVMHRNSMNLKIPGQLMMNYMNTLLGKPINGETIADSSIAPMVRAIGLTYLMKNLVTNTNLPKDEITELYFSEQFVVDDL